MSEVPKVSTPATEDMAVKAIVKRLLPMVGVETQEAAQLFMAQLWLESGRGRSMFNNNWGNITAGKSWTGDFWRPPWFNKAEVDALPDGDNKTRLLSLHQLMLENKAPQKFRAYSTATTGFDDYVRQLQNNFKLIIEAAKTGDPLKFTEAIQKSGYAPDVIPASHAKTIASLAKEFAKKGLFQSLPKASSVVAAVEVGSSQEPSSSPLPEPSSSGPLPSSPGSPVVPSSGELPNLQMGAVGSAVELFRYLTIGGSGILTEDDDKLVKDYQTANGLKRDGLVGPLTWAHVLDSHSLRKTV